MRHYISIIALIILLLLGYSIELWAHATSSCTQFNQIALTLAFVQDKMQAPLSLAQLAQTLGYIKPEATTIVRTYSWIHKKQVLLVTTHNDNITTKILTGTSDGSITSTKLVVLYEKLQKATSSWSIQELTQQLGPPYVTSEKLHHYRWHCGIGTIEVTAKQDDTLTTATISYQAAEPATITAQLGSNHPPWTHKHDYLNSYYRAFKRTYTTSR